MLIRDSTYRVILMSSNPAKSNLPAPSYVGVVTFYVTSEIDAPIDKVWTVLTDFEKYPEWYAYPYFYVCQHELTCSFHKESVCVRSHLIQRCSRTLTYSHAVRER